MANNRAVWVLRPVAPNSGRLRIGAGTGQFLDFVSFAAGVDTQRFKFDDTGHLTVTAGITLSAFSTAGVVHNNTSGVFFSSLIVDADVSAVGWAKITGTPTTLSGYGITDAVPGTRTVTAGAGLTGGGALSSNITINAVANADGSIVVNADDIQVGVLATDAQHGNRGGGALHTAVTNSAAGFASAITAANRLFGSTSGTSAGWVQVVDAMVSTVGWSKITGTPSTLTGYGITDAVPNSRTLTGTAPIAIDGVNTAVDLSTGRTISVANATTGAPGVVQLTADLAGTGTSPQVARVKGTAVTTAGGSLTTGQSLRVTGASTADWGAIDLANASAVTGTLPVGNLPVSGGGSSVVGVARTLTGSGAIKIAGDNSPHDLSADRTISVASASTSNLGVIQLATDLNGTATAPVVAQLTGVFSTVSIVANALQWATAATPSITQVAAVSGSGAGMLMQAQAGASGGAGGTLTIGGGDPGSSGSTAAGDTIVKVGAPFSAFGASPTAALRIRSQSSDILSIAQSDTGITKIDSSGNTFEIAKATRFDGAISFNATASGGGPNSGEYWLTSLPSASRDKVYFGLGGGPSIGSTTPRYFAHFNQGTTTSITANQTVSTLGTVYVDAPTYDLGGGTSTISGRVATVVIAGAPQATNGAFSGNVYALDVVAGVAHFGGGIVSESTSLSIGPNGSQPLFIDGIGQVFIGDGTNQVVLNGLGGLKLKVSVSTSATSGSAGALPSNPHRYLILDVDGLGSIKIPAYNL